MAHSREDPTVAHPQVFTLHWEGPDRVTLPVEPGFPDSPDEGQQTARSERERERREAARGGRARALWDQIRREALERGDPALWSRKLDAYWWVKLAARGNAGEYARGHDLNHATVRTWISDVARVAYEVGYQLHEDKLLLVGRAPAGLRRLRELVNRAAASQAAWQELRTQEAGFRGSDPYFHLNEGHVLRARGRLRESDATLREGLTIAEAPPIRTLLWNARGQTFWDCGPDSRWAIVQHLELAERCFRRAVLLDPC
ncbi:MAG: hypothetical protein ABFS46_10040, partial [Myxococcota bacterium]